jgi:hypothetical protein
MSLTTGCLRAYAVDRHAISDGVVQVSPPTASLELAGFGRPRRLTRRPAAPAAPPAQILELKMVDANGPNGTKTQRCKCVAAARHAVVGPRAPAVGSPSDRRRPPPPPPAGC